MYSVDSSYGLKFYYKIFVSDGDTDDNLLENDGNIFLSYVLKQFRNFNYICHYICKVEKVQSVISKIKTLI